MSLPSEAEIREKMEILMKSVDLETMSTKQFIAALSNQFGGVDLSEKKKFIKATITEIIDSMENEDKEDEDDEEEEEEEDDDSGSEEESEEEEEVVAAAPKKKKSSGSGGGGGGGLQAVKEISPELASFLNSGREMARTAIVKGLWDYIKAHNLQNPDDKREILLDDRMKSVFGVDRFNMFSMNKYIGAHIHPYKPVDLTTTSASKKRKEDGGGEKKAKKPKVKGKPGQQAPYRLSSELAAVVGKPILPRPQVTQALWAYIRRNNLQNPEDKREILCDDALRAVMGGESKVTMFTMNKYITPHMLEKLDKSAYTHEEAEKEESAEEDSGDEAEEE
eukprot:CAMPEP_0171345612 /NCGR_PEP_ID=MMETSP0878-20121228/22088_1 /TAXON_ID=67004 /ORGANISM="Thalassiosira weissflogii, Strain CCMP1336" /LENGTH=334 /DNA_ID=CAMNT_0011849073 /DNA_START=87 /DNA_END=1091 /DNA_ORIENTATION=+